MVACPVVLALPVALHRSVRRSEVDWNDIPVAEDPIRQLLDRRVPWIIHEDLFSQQSFGVGQWPDQGWKLHVSATPFSAPAVLEAALDVLLGAGVRFKVVSTLSLLAAMNSSAFGTTQIGKFITVYPHDDATAVALAVDLDAATAGHSGPRIPSDRPLNPGSLVHYRYGSIRRLPESEAFGRTDGAYDLLDPAGRLADDTRLDFYRPPHSQIVDPFEAAGVRVPLPARRRFLNDRYLITDALAQSARGGVFRAVDVGVRPARLCLVKESWHDVGLDAYGRDARDWAINEQHILTRYADSPGLPQCLDGFEIDGDFYLVIEYLDGTPLDSVLAEQDPLDGRMKLDDLVAVGLATADALAGLHEIGLVFRDFKPANVIKTPDGAYQLIDFGIAYEYCRDTEPPLSIGTPPFYSAEQFELGPPDPADDVFAWGAVLHYLAVGRASVDNRGDEVLQPFSRRPVTELAPWFPPAIAAVIDRAVAWERADRYRSMRDARTDLAAAAAGVAPSRDARDSITYSIPLSGNRSDSDRVQAPRLAREVGDALCEEAEEHGAGVCWRRRFEWNDDSERSPDLYGGAAGVGLFLAELAHVTGNDRYGVAARGAAQWLCGPAWGRGRAQHGFHNGEAGVAFFLLRLAELLDCPGYIDAAAMRLRRLRGAACHTIDIMYGSAGTILGLLACHAATGANEFLDDARTLAKPVLDQALPAGDGVYWEVASAAPGGPVLPYLGLLHGSAGVGLALAALARVTGDERYRRAAIAVARHLVTQAVPIDSEVGPALAWPRFVGDTKPGMQAQCHGSGGIALFFLLLDGMFPDADYPPVARGAARALLARETRATQSGICHGVSGAGHLMLDCYQSLGDLEWLSLADSFNRQLQDFRVDDRTGIYALQHGQSATPDLMLGYAGVGSFLLRIADPAGAPDLVWGRLRTAWEIH